MQITFVLPVGAFSINRAYARDMRYKTPAYKDWHTKVSYLLEQIPELKVMAAKHNAEGGEFEIELSAIYPPSIFSNKKGEISSKTFDVTNVEKLFVDVLFGDTMGVNDKHITCLISKKRAGARLSIECTISLIAP